MTEQILLNKLLGAFEKLTGFHAVVQSDHAYIHEGYAQTAIIETPSSATPYYIGFTTPTVESNKFIHWRPLGLQSSADYVTVKLFEDVAFTGGSATTVFNRNRNRQPDSPSVMQAFNEAVSASPTGDPIQQVGMGTSGNAFSRSGGSAGADEELLLLPDTDYVIQIIPAGTTIITVTSFWYEEEPVF